MEYVMLKDVCAINMGQSPDSDSYNNNGEGVPFFQGNADFGERYPVVRKWCSAPTKMAAPEDILISVRAPIGAMNYAKEECCIGRGLAALTPDRTKVSPEFLFWLLKEKNTELNSKGTGSTFKAIGKKVLEETMIPNIPIEKQLEYSEALEKVHAIIQMRKKEIQHLDDLIKARFVEMFGGSDSELNRWKQEPLGNICKRVKRYPTFCNMEYLESGVRVIRIGNILQDGHMDVEDKNYVFVYEKANDDFPETIIERNDIVMAVRGDGSAASRIGIITEEKLIGANISPNLIRMQADSEKILPLFFFYYLTGEVGQKRLDSYVNKTAKKNIAAKDIVKVMTPIPPLDIQRQFVSLVEQVDKSKVVVQKALDETQILFNSLMQQYFG